MASGVTGKFLSPFMEDDYEGVNLKKIYEAIY